MEGYLAGEAVEFNSLLVRSMVWFVGGWWLVVVVVVVDWTYGIVISNCSSASLSNSGDSFSRSDHVFLTIAAPECGVDSTPSFISTSLSLLYGT